jgi:PDZ domain-containing secreted protein
MGKSFKIGKVIPNEEVPNWTRRAPKWEDIIDAISRLKPGQTITVEFDDRTDAIRARNTVRDRINAQEGHAVLGTRVTTSPDKSTTKVFFSRYTVEEAIARETK